MARTRKLTYWYAAILDDSNVYSIRARTLREAIEQVAATGQPKAFGKPVKVTVAYTDVFDLVQQSLGEGGIDEPYYASMNPTTQPGV